MTRRKARLGDEDRAHKAHPEGPKVFQPQRERPHALIPVRRLSDGAPTYLSVRWPASTARRGPVDPPVEREIIDLEGRQKVTVTYEDPYLRAEELAAQRRGTA